MIERVGVGTIAKASSGDLVPGLPADIAANDILLCFAGDSDIVATLPMDVAWTPTAVPAYPLNAAHWHRYDGVTPPDTTVTYTGAVAAAAFIVAYRGCHTEGHPFDFNVFDDGMGNPVQVFAPAGPIASPTINFSGMTPTYIGDMVICAWRTNLFGPNSAIRDAYPEVTTVLDDGFTGVGGAVGFGFADGINPSGDPPGPNPRGSTYSAAVSGIASIMLLRQDGAVGIPGGTAMYSVSSPRPGEVQ